jgi:hypothetical protein
MSESKDMHDKAMTWATVVMAVATLVMMWTSIQQTLAVRAADAFTREQDRLKLVAAKRELRHVAWDCIFDLSLPGELHRLKTKQECVVFAKSLHDRMNGVADNYYLQHYPNEAATWSKVIDAYEWYLTPNIFNMPYTQLTATNAMETTWTDERVVEMLVQQSSPQFERIMQVYKNLKLSNYTFEQIPELK